MAPPSSGRARPAARGGPTGVGRRPVPARSPMAPPRQALPTYALYGEQVPRQATDWLHVESIAERSRLHGWEIRPHRHERLFQLLVLLSGEAQARLAGGSVALRGPCVLAVPPLEPHGFRFDPAVQGTVVTVLETHLAQLLAAAPALRDRLLRPPAQPLALAPGGDEAGALQAALQALLAEAAGSAPWRDLALDAALLRLLVLLGRWGEGAQPGAALAAVPSADGAPVRAGPAGSAGEPAATSRAGADRGSAAQLPSAAATGPRAAAHVARYRALVDRSFRQQPPLARLAAELGLSPTQLNRVCQQVLGHSALGVLHGRLVLEAQRELAYSTLAIKQIALGLGFADAAYFTRFFWRHCGCAPSAWRARAAAG